MVKFKHFFEWIKIFFCYYRKFDFLKTHFLFGMSYLFINPYKVSKWFLQQRGESNVHVYGETFITTMDKIACECNITKDDVVYDLGCGRGLNMFWLNSFVGCKVIGIEQIPLFVEKGNRLVSKLNKKELISFYKKDIIDVDFSYATIIYFYGTGFNEEIIKKLTVNLEKSANYPKIITISFPLTDYNPMFNVIKQFKVNFVWGSSDVFLQEMLPSRYSSS